ncbi:hypothetical protein EC991_005041 [Linnemannia zychae]|nr:hypothetical protein EC991_005041 [Linnemannia zychae]
MDPLSNLPPECLHQILQLLADDNTTISPLIALLSTNKYIASSTLPYIYADINKLVEGYSVSSIGTRMRRSLVRMLLQRVLLDGRGDLSEMLMLLYGFEKDDISHSSNDNNDNYSNSTNYDTHNATTNNSDNARSALARTKSPVDYLAYIRHLNLDIEHLGHQHGFIRPLSSPHKEDALKAHFAAYNDIFMSWSLIRERCEGAIIYWEVTWSIANLILEQLESLTIPLADIKRYMDAINRLGQLETVRFNLDESFKPYYRSIIDQNNGVSNHAIKSMQTMVLFIKEHQRLFKGQLKSVSVCDELKWHLTSALCPKEILWQVAQASPPLHRPRHLAPVNWLQLAGHPLSTDLSHVVSLTSRQLTAELFNSLVSVQEILSRCRSLKELTVRSLGTDGFKWAVQEKKAMLDRLCRNGKGGQLLLPESAPSSHIASTKDPHGLVPLSSIHIEEFSTVEEIDDIAFAFSQTLESLIVDKYSDLHLLQPVCTLGQGWADLPLLTKLSFRGCCNRLEIDNNLLSHFPNIVCLELADYTSDYNCSDIVSCSAASLTSLEELELIGWPALTFHPETLCSTTRIKTLRMMTRVEEDDSYYIPPLVELDRSFGGGAIEAPRTLHEGGVPATAPGSLVNVRPQWSWDWLLPCLGTLELSSEFAFRFQFRMLQGCPNLRWLSLDISTNEDDHPRVLTTADLFMGPLGTGKEAGAQSVAELGSSVERIVSGVTNLTLSGEWIIDDSMLDPFLLGMFPKLRGFTGREGVRGYTMENMMAVKALADTHGQTCWMLS